MYLARLKGMSKEEATKRITYWFDKFGIDAWRGKSSRFQRNGSKYS